MKKTLIFGTFMIPTLLLTACNSEKKEESVQTETLTD